MPSRPSRTGSSNLFGERQPLLKQHTVDALTAIRPDLEAAAPGESGTYRAWKVFLFLVCTICLNAVLTLLPNDNGEGGESDYLHPSQTSKPRFDFKWALWRALGGGTTGAIGANALCVYLLKTTYPPERTSSGPDTSRDLDGEPLLVYASPSLTRVFQPLRTTLNYQHRNSTTIAKAIKTLHSNGSYARYYQGLSIALIYRTLARFGDTASNVGVLALLGSNTSTGQLPSPIKTVFASLCATAFRFIIAPIDTVCTTFQVDGKSGLKSLRKRVRLRYFEKFRSFPRPWLTHHTLQTKERGMACLWSGALAAASISFVEHYFVSE